jgi:hypothetical protein
VDKPLVHCSVSALDPPRDDKEEPFTKAYIHHLLMVHEYVAIYLLCAPLPRLQGRADLPFARMTQAPRLDPYPVA